MLLSLRAGALVAICSLLTMSSAHAETKLVIEGTHLCCGGCVRGAQEALTGIEGVTSTVSQKDQSITIVAANDEAGQKAVNALADSGFHGQLKHATIKFPAIKSPEGQVKRLEISGIHNCCGACTRSIKEALSNVKGIEANTVKPKEETFVLEGNFSASAVVEALEKAGFHHSVK